MRRQYAAEQEFWRLEVPLELLIRSSEITSRECVGAGNFGVVCKALLNRNDNTQYVAMKTLKGALFECALTDYLLYRFDE